MPQNKNNEEHKSLFSRDDDEEEDFPPNFTSLMQEQEKCKSLSHYLMLITQYDLLNFKLTFI